MNNFFITGTGTGVGKTFCSILLAKKYNTQYYKPIQCGIDEIDSETVAKNDIVILPSTYCFKTPSSPHFAAKQENIEIDINKLIKNFDKPTIVEGAGGVLVPINKNQFMIDVIKYFDLPTIIVTTGIVGTINHTLLTINALKNANVNIEGVIVNGEASFDNIEAIKYYGKVNIIDL